MIPATLAIGALAFLAIAGLLSAVEAAFFYLSRQEAEQLLAHKPKSALRAILDDPVPHTNALRLWRLWFEMATAVAVAMLFTFLIENLWIAGLAATLTMSLMAFVVVGVSPRRLGRNRASSFVAGTAPLIRLLRMVLGPIPQWLVAVGNKLSPGETSGDEAFFSEEHFRDMVDRANEADMIEDVEAEFIHSVFDLGDTRVRSVMVPRTDMVTVDSGTSLAECMTLCLKSGCSRIPVIQETSDHIVGIVYLKDIARELHFKSDPDSTVDDIARDVRYVPESKSVAELLKELQIESTHVAIVIDEYGGTAGLVTLEDLIEEIVGEIDDEYDRSRPDVEEVRPGVFRISARTPLDDLGELFHKDLEDDEVDTAGGLLAKYLGRVPIVGSEVSVEGIHLHAETLEGRRNRIGFLLTWFEPEDTEEDEESHGSHGSSGRRDSADIHHLESEQAS